MPDSNPSNVNLSVPVRRRRRLRPFPLILIILSGALLACEGCYFLVAIPFRPKKIGTPAEVEKIASQIIDWKLPPGFEARTASVSDNLLQQFKIAAFAQDRGRGQLVLSQIRTTVWPHDELIEMNGPDLKNVKITQKEFRTLSVHGLPAKFELGRGEDRASTTLYRQVTGKFRGKIDDVSLMLQYEEGILTDQQVEEFLNSIK